MKERETIAPRGTPETAFFSRTYDEAMTLVRQARDYLAHAGPGDSSGLGLEESLAYSVESMRLTARLTQVTAWLMAQRAVHLGELSREEVRQSRWRLGGHEICLAAPLFALDGLPPGLLDLLERSETLFRRVSRLDALLAGGPA